MAVDAFAAFKEAQTGTKSTGDQPPNVATEPEKLSASATPPTDDQFVALRQMGDRFLDTVLAMGGSMPAAEVYRRFRGRDPSVQPLLAHLGLLQPEQRV